MSDRRVNKKLAILCLIVVFGLFARSLSAQQYVSIGQGVLHVLGMGLSVDPEEQTAPINTGTAVNTNMVFPAVDFGSEIPGVPQDLLVMAELTGPGIVDPITISARPDEQLMIPPLPQEGSYVLDNIRLVSGDQVILYANPSVATIDTIKKLLITQVTSRALDIDEIEDLGIRITSDNFTVYEFTVGFGTESDRVEMKLPVVLEHGEPHQPESEGSGSIPPMGLNVPGLNVPNLLVKGIKLFPYTEDFGSGGVAPISGVIVIPGNIAFLNQFFEVLLLVTNNAPDGTPLVVTNLQASISLPAGEDNIPDSIDDPLRVAELEDGVHPMVPVVRVGDGAAHIGAQESAEGKFYVEGLREGTHQVDIEITGTLEGLPSGLA